MTGCAEARELFAALVEDELDAASQALVHEHLVRCDDCTGLVAALRLVNQAGATVHDLVPPEHLEQDIARSPCRRWLGLLFRAVDREISEHNLSRLLAHLELCPPCRQTWNDLTLIHQVGEVMLPPPGLIGRCISVRCRPRASHVLGRRTVAAAAYLLAVLGSLLIGNPVSLARQEQAAATVQRIATTVTNEVSEVAEDGRGELRVMLWRSLQWSRRQADTLASIAHLLIDDTNKSKETPDERHDQP